MRVVVVLVVAAVLQLKSQGAGVLDLQQVLGVEERVAACLSVL